MIPLIHITTISQGVPTSFFIFKEWHLSEFFHIIGQRKKGQSVSNFCLYLNKSGVKSYFDTLCNFSNNKGKISLITMHEETMWSCPVWTYKELCRRIPASDLHLLNHNNHSYIDYYSMKKYLNVIKNAIYEPVGYEGYSGFGNYNETVYDRDGNFVGCDGWVSEDY